MQPESQRNMKLTFKIIAATIIGALSVTIHAQSPATGQLLGHGYVDLGLSVVWATCNIGAESPSDYGDYFAWGEAETKSTYTESNSATYEKNDFLFLDAAQAHWGSRWRMPTWADYKELVDRCTWQWTTLDSKSGYKVIGPNGNSIFLPAAGERDGSALNYVDQRGVYWLGTYSSSNFKTARSTDFTNNKYLYTRRDNRYLGRCIRPVADEISEQELEKRFTGTILGHDYVDLGLSVAWATCNVGASSPEDYGNYYAWGEAVSKTKFKKSNSSTYKKSNYVFLDAAMINWGSQWRMPTDKECEELVNWCDWKWTTINGQKGYKITGPNGRFIFLPASGVYYETSHNGSNQWSQYWSSSEYKNMSEYATTLSIDGRQFETKQKGTDYQVVFASRYNGSSVRPVIELTKTQMQ